MAEEFWPVLPFELFAFCVKIERQKAGIVTRPIVLRPWIAETDNDFHICYYSTKKGGRMGPPSCREYIRRV
jgi:hypothetical protein